MNSFLGVPKLDANGSISAGQDCMFELFSTEEKIVGELLRDHPGMLQLYNTQQSSAVIRPSYWRNKLKGAVRLYHFIILREPGLFSQRLPAGETC
jgi:hypothetical protein